jgi:hypothetical protein
MHLAETLRTGWRVFAAPLALNHDINAMQVSALDDEPLRLQSLEHFQMSLE